MMAEKAADLILMQRAQLRAAADAHMGASSPAAMPEQHVPAPMAAA